MKVPKRSIPVLHRYTEKTKTRRRLETVKEKRERRVVDRVYEDGKDIIWYQDVCLPEGIVPEGIPRNVPHTVQEKQQVILPGHLFVYVVRGRSTTWPTRFESDPY